MRNFISETKTLFKRRKQFVNGYYCNPDQITWQVIIHSFCITSFGEKNTSNG